MNLKSTWQRKMDAQTVVQYRKVRKILKAAGYLQPKIKQETEQQRVYREGRA
jgi:hypothetical protein